MYVPRLLYSSVTGRLGCFHVLAIVNSASMNIAVYISFQIIIFSEYMPRSRIAGKYGIYIYISVWRRQWHPTPVLLPGNSYDGGAWWAAVHGVAKSWT